MRALPALTILLLFPCAPRAADQVLAWVGKTGDVRFGRGPQLDEWPPRLGGSAPLRLELNAHAPGWLHIPQSDFVVTKLAKPNAHSRTLSADLVVPDGTSATLGVHEQLEVTGSGLTATYDLRAKQATRLCGLQVSLLLDCTAYAGASVALTGLKTLLPGRTAPDQQAFDAVPDGQPDFAEATPTTVTLPIASEGNFRLYDGYCDKLTVTGGSGLPFTLTSAKPMRLIMQDNRRWGTDVYELRLAFIMADGGREVPAETAFHAEVRVEVGEGLSLSP